jgi:hypothetical protein
MKVRQLPIWLQELVKIRTKEGGVYYDEDKGIIGLFQFDKTPEGAQYWSDINKGIIPPQPVAQQISVRDAERIIRIKHFKYDKDTLTFTINLKDLTSSIPLRGDAIPKRLIINNPNTGYQNIFELDELVYGEVIPIPYLPGNTYSIKYRIIRSPQQPHYIKSNQDYKINVQVYTQP